MAIATPSSWTSVSEPIRPRIRQMTSAPWRSSSGACCRAARTSRPSPSGPSSAATPPRPTSSPPPLTPCEEGGDAAGESHRRTEPVQGPEAIRWSPTRGILRRAGLASSWHGFARQTRDPVRRAGGASGAGKSSTARAGVLASILESGWTRRHEFISDLYPVPTRSASWRPRSPASRSRPRRRSARPSSPGHVASSSPSRKCCHPARGWSCSSTSWRSSSRSPATRRSATLPGTDPRGDRRPGWPSSCHRDVAPDFYDRPLAYQRFGALLASSTEALPPLSPDDYELAIRRPAEGVASGCEAGVVGALIADVVDEPGALPLLDSPSPSWSSSATVRAGRLVGAHPPTGGLAGALLQPVRTRTC